MKTCSFVSAAVLALLLSGRGAPVAADTADANCEVLEEGGTRKGASIPCMFSQRQGYISLDLRNGETYSLAPTDRHGEYQDQGGHKVVRTATGNSEEFKWEGGKKILLTYSGSLGAVPPVSRVVMAAAPGGTPDSFDTICGVIFDGKHYRYRCGVTDFHSDGQRVGTELRYPDQTIQLSWYTGNRVGLQFEGMVPKEVRYAISEGETNFIFEEKTYFYYSDKGRAQMEWKDFHD
jgi:hypothetical protein